MNKQQSNYEDETDELLMSDEMEFTEEEIGEEEEERIYRSSRAFNMQMRHRIEERLEQRRLLKELGDYDLMDLDDDDDTYH